MLYKILTQFNQTARLSISKESEIADYYKDGDRITLTVGIRSKKVTINRKDGMEKEAIMVTTDVLDTLSIPQGFTYQLISTKKTIRIGPIIGLLIFTKKKDMTNKSLKRSLDYSISYNKINGLLYVFSLDGIDFNTKTINGFCYNPLRLSWEEGVYPFPDAIYRRVSMPKKILDSLQHDTNNRVYNSTHFNKLDFWNTVSSSERISEHLPMTKMYQSIQDIDKMFERYKILYLKPINSTRAYGLMRITKGKNYYSIQEKMVKNPEIFYSKEEAERYIETIRRGRRYLIQEGIDLLNFDNRYIDFRVIMQKDQFLSWQCVVIITSIGKRGGVCSNYNMDDQYLSFEDFLNMYFNISKKEVFQKRKEIIALCKQACKMLDKSGKNYADLGVDVGLDKNLKPWIFEMNNRRHSHRMALYINDYDSYYRMKSNPVLYGTKISGYKVL